MTIIEVQPIIEIQTVTTYVNVVGVNVIIKSKVTEKQVFKDREPKKAKNDAT